MNTLKELFERYTGFVKAVLVPLGAFGVFAIAFVDAAFMGIPLDPVVAAWVYKDPSRWWMYALMASSGSALGSTVLWWLGLKGGEPLLEKRIGKRRVEQLRDRFARQEFIALAGASLLPPPTPFKLFVVASGVFDMKLRNFLSAIFVGRMLRFTIVSYLTIQFGPQVAEITRQLMRDYLPHTLIALGVLVLAGLIYWLMRRARARSPRPVEE